MIGEAVPLDRPSGAGRVVPRAAAGLTAAPLWPSGANRAAPGAMNAVAPLRSSGTDRAAPVVEVDNRMAVPSDRPSGTGRAVPSGGEVGA